MPNVTLYAYGFDGDAEKVGQEVADIGPTLFDVVIMAFIHVDEGGGLRLGSTPVEQLWPGLPDAIEQLKTGYTVPKRVLMSIGGWDNANDWVNLGKYSSQAIANLVSFAQSHNIDGIDLDFEGGPNGYDETCKQVVAKTVGAYKGQVPVSVVTMPPYMDEDWWAGPGGVLALTAVGGRNLVDWFNVQFYVGESDYPPDSYPSTFEAWSGLVGTPANHVASPDEFVNPGCNGAADTGFKPADLTEGLLNVRNAKHYLGGGFVWEYTSLNGPAAEWANAIRGGLS
jgi:glycosyl hydrolase family 18 (putative chitinase)